MNYHQQSNQVWLEGKEVNEKGLKCTDRDQSTRGFYGEDLLKWWRNISTQIAINSSDTRSRNRQRANTLFGM